MPRPYPPASAKRPEGLFMFLAFGKNSGRYELSGRLNRLAGILHFFPFEISREAGSPRQGTQAFVRSLVIVFERITRQLR
jgi:hypothetical protein